MDEVSIITIAICCDGNSAITPIGPYLYEKNPESSLVLSLFETLNLGKSKLMNTQYVIRNR